LGGSNSYRWILIVAIFSVCFGMTGRLARIRRSRFSVRIVVYYPRGLTRAIDLLQTAETSPRGISPIDLLVSSAHYVGGFCIFLTTALIFHLLTLFEVATECRLMAYTKAGTGFGEIVVSLLLQRLPHYAPHMGYCALPLRRVLPHTAGCYPTSRVTHLVHFTSSSSMIRPS
jgi:hypothetical protein